MTMAIQGTSILETHIPSTIGRIATNSEWKQFQTYYFRYHTKDKEYIVRGCDKSMPIDVCVLTAKAPSKRRIELLKDILHAFHAGYESIADKKK